MNEESMVPLPADAREFNEVLIRQMKANHALHSPVIEEAYRRVFRHQFLPNHSLEEAYSDMSVFTRDDKDRGGYYSGSSCPSVMASMLEMLQVERGMKVLEIGAGTGYNAALLSELTGSPDCVTTIDLDGSICEEARRHLSGAGYPSVQVLCADGWKGDPGAAPYDRIIVTAAAHDIAPAWFAQLAEGGIIVVPWAKEGSVFAFRKEGRKLVKLGRSDAGFMAMRGEFPGEVILQRVGGFYVWQSSWLTPHDTVRLGQLLQQNTWEDLYPLPVGQPKDGPGINFWHFLIYLTIEEPLLVVMKWIADDGEVKIKLGWVDLNTLEAVFLSYPLDNPVRLTGYGNGTFSDEPAARIRRWDELGQPGPERLQLTAYPSGDAPPPQGNETLIRRKWFDYITSWS